MSRFCILLIALTAFFGGSSQILCATEEEMQPPVAPVKEHITEIHGQTMVDPYHWMRYREDPQVLNYLEEENRYAYHVMKPLENVKNKLYQELKSRIIETDMSVPQRIDDYYYYSRTERGMQYSIHCRRLVGSDIEEIIFDENKHAQGHPYFSLGVLKVSPNHQILAYSVDTSGAERFELSFINLKTNEKLPGTIASTTYGLEWANDSKTVFYTLMDHSGRANRIKRHVVGQQPEESELVYEETDGRFWIRINKTRDNKYLLVSSNSATTSEVSILSANSPDDNFKVFVPRTPGIEYNLEHRKGTFYILTNKEAENFKIVKAPDENYKQKNWTDFIAHRENVLIDNFDAFENYIVIYYRENGLQKIGYYDFASNQLKDIKFHEAVYSIRRATNPMFCSDVLRYTYSSLTTPASVYDYSMKTKELKLKKQYEVAGTFYKNNYKSERLMAKSHDGTMVPISLVYRKDMFISDKPSNLYLTGYGSYGASYDPYFSSYRLSLLDRGFVFAIAHVRGGQELGRKWYEDGKLLNKKNTFKDFIACAEHLIEHNYTTSDKLAISGMSAGGLLMGAVVNMRPDLFGVVIADVPFVDIVNTMLDPDLPLVREEYEEWGNPEEEKYFNYMYSYGPYENLVAARYPDMLITAGLNDTRVLYWEPAKYTARLRTLNQSDSTIILKTNMAAGHSGASGRYDFLKEIAFEYAFIFKCLDVEF